MIQPSSFTGSPRYTTERTQDAMTYVREHGRPHLFITLTCNPNRKEMTDHHMIEMIQSSSKISHPILNSRFPLCAVFVLRTTPSVGLQKIPIFFIDFEFPCVHVAPRYIHILQHTVTPCGKHTPMLPLQKTSVNM